MRTSLGVALRELIGHPAPDPRNNPGDGWNDKESAS